LRDPARVRDAIAAAAGQTSYPNVVYWEPHGIAQGDAGLALLCAQLDACCPDEGWDVAGHQFLASAVRGAERAQGLSPGIFGGVSGLAFAAWSLARGGTRYQRLLESLEEALVPQTMQLAERVARRNGMPVSEFDLISGLAGIGAYLLCRRHRPAVADALDATLRSLVALTVDGGVTPRWHTPARFMADTSMADHHPYGNLNCGLAHGIPGPLALMALAYRDGALVPGLADALHQAATWLVDHRTYDDWGMGWPTAVPLNADGLADPTVTAEPSRTAWCYGNPGVARALWLASDALDDAAMGGLAVEAMEAVFRRPVPLRRIDSPTFCHGMAGVLQITLRFARDTGLPSFASAAGTLTQQLLDQHEPDRLLGYYSLEPGGNRVDQPGLLDGSPGVVLALLAAAGPAEPFWDRLFLLA
jgi:hypothetical protein